MFGQLGPSSITITATRTNNIQPDQVLVGLNVTSGATAGLDDLTSALTGAGISGATFTGVYTANIYPSTNFLIWSFTLTAPLAKLSSILSQVLSAHQTISANNSGLTLTFYVEGMQVSQQLRQSQPCSQASLLVDAQAQAKQVAAVAGVSAGPILSMAEGGGAVLAQGAPALAAVAIPANLGGAFIFPTVFNFTCSLTVQFQLM
jgi:hypothetical protein